MAECRDFWAPCGVTQARRSSATKSALSNPLSAPSVNRLVDPGECWSIMSMAARRSTAICPREIALHDQPRPVLRQGMTDEAKRGAGARGLFENRASGSVVEAWVALARFSPRKSTSALRL